VTVETFVARSRLPASAEDAWAWHARPGALERLSPPWERVEIAERSGDGIEKGTRVVLRLRSGPFRVRWVAVHGEAEPGRSFEDVQESGPFATWRHRHIFHPVDSGTCDLEDRVEFALPGGRPGNVLGRRLVRRRLDRLFAYRHAVTAGDLERIREFSAAPRLTVAITGATGLVGRRLAAFLGAGGHAVRRIVRRDPGPADVLWDPSTGRLDRAALEGVDAVVHLAGESVAAGRWTEARMREILESRSKGTRLLAGALASMKSPPRVFVSASAVGYYGSRGDERLDELSASGDGFLAEVARVWEDAASPAVGAGIRTVKLRLGVVLAGAGGALAKMVPAFRAGAGGPIGGGRQGLSWVALDDVLGAIHFALLRGDVSGALNVTAPEPVEQRAFARTLGAVLRRPSLAPLPSPAVRLLFGRMGEEMLLGGSFVIPRRLLESGFRFRFASLEEALRFELGRLKATATAS
jgi:hypothetical protein